MIALVLLATAGTVLFDSRAYSEPVPANPANPANPAAVKPSSYSSFPHSAHSIKQKSDRLSEALQVIIKEGEGKSLEELHAEKTAMGLKRGLKISSLTTESTMKLEWTPSQSHDDLSNADAGDIIRYEFYTKKSGGEEDECADEDRKGSFIYGLNKCTYMLDGSFYVELGASLYHTSDSAPHAYTDCVCNSICAYVDDSCTTPYNHINHQNHQGNCAEWCTSTPGKDICYYYGEGDDTTYTYSDDYFESKFDDRNARSFNNLKEYDDDYISGLNEQTQAFKADAHYGSMIDIHNHGEHITISKHWLDASACQGSNDDAFHCSDIEEKSIMTQTWDYPDSCSPYFKVGNIDDDIKNEPIGTQIYQKYSCSTEGMGPVWRAYSDPECRKEWNNHGLLHKWIPNSDGSDHQTPTFDDTDNIHQKNSNSFNFKVFWTCTQPGPKSFYPIMVALIVGFVIVLPASLLALYVVNKKLGWSLATACRRALSMSNMEAATGGVVEETAKETAPPKSSA